MGRKVRNPWSEFWGGQFCFDWPWVNQFILRRLHHRHHLPCLWWMMFPRSRCQIVLKCLKIFINIFLPKVISNLPVFASTAYRIVQLVSRPLAFAFFHSLNPFDFKSFFFWAAAASESSFVTHGQTTFFSNASFIVFFMWPSKTVCGSADHLQSSLK